MREDYVYYSLAEKLNKLIKTAEDKEGVVFDAPYFKPDTDWRQDLGAYKFNKMVEFFVSLGYLEKDEIPTLNLSDDWAYSSVRHYITKFLETPEFGEGTEEILKLLFGFRTSTLEGDGGYGSSDVWVINPDENPEINLLPSLRFTAKAGDVFKKFHLASRLTQTEADEGSFPIAQMGLYKNDENKTLVYSQEFRGDKDPAIKWNELPVDAEIVLEEGVEYFLGLAVNGWTNWSEFNPEIGGSTVYGLSEAQVLEDIGGLSGRSSNWMVPFYAEVERTIIT